MTRQLLALQRSAPTLLANIVGPIRNLPVAANDNAAASLRSPRIRAAIKHFARHGLAAVEVAARRAMAAHAAGDKSGYQHWLSICRALDMRRAASIEQQLRPLSLAQV